MRVVVLGTRGFPNVQGGVEVHCENLYPLLVREGCEVVVMGRAPYVGIKTYLFRGVRVVPLPAIQNKFLEAFLHTFLGIWVARKYEPDLLHIHSIGPGFFIPMARMLGFRVVLTTHGENYRHLKWGFFARSFLRMSEFLAVVFANKVIAISRTIAQGIWVKFRKTAVVIPNGVKPVRRRETWDILKKYGLEHNKYILAVGRFVPEKGFHDLLDAYAMFGDKDRKLVIVGTADHEDNYSRALREKAMRIPGVVLPGFLNGTPLEELYSHAGLFVLPSYYEGLPIVLLEALSYGLNCLISDIPANREVGLEEDRYFKTGDTHDLSVKLAELFGKTLSEGQVQSEMDLMDREYNWQTIARRTIYIYNCLLCEK